MIDKIKNVKELQKAYCELEKEFTKKTINMYAKKCKVLDKALELACKNICFEDICYYCEYNKNIDCPNYCEREIDFDIKQAIRYFIEQAEEELKK